MEVQKSSVFARWLEKLRDRKGRIRIQARIERLEHGNPGDVKPVGEGVSEMRIKYGPGYRVYYQQRGKKIAILLCGGDKSTQEDDIQKAKQIAKDWAEQAK